MTDLTLRQIEKIRTVLASAIEAGGMRALDRDTVIAALRDLYDEVLAMPSLTPSPSMSVDDGPAGDALPCDAPAEESHDADADTEEPREAPELNEPSESRTEERESRLAEVTLPWADASPATPESLDEPERPCPEPDNAPQEETSTREEPEEEKAEDDAAATAREETPETLEAEVEEVPEEEPVAAEEVTEENEEPAGDIADDSVEEEPETVIVAESDTADKEERHDPVEEITLSAEPILPEPTRLERMLADERSLAARLGQERLVAVADELCHGDTETCLDMMEALEATGDFDMAVLYIQEHYPQKSDSRAIDMLVEVLSAKFI